MFSKIQGKKPSSVKPQLIEKIRLVSGLATNLRSCDIQAAEAMPVCGLVKSDCFLLQLDSPQEHVVNQRGYVGQGGVAL